MSEFEGLLFYFFGAIMLLASVGVVTLRNPVHCALLLVLAFMSGAVLWLLLGAEFLAWVLVLVYVGAVMVLFLFVVMMLDINIDRLREGFWRWVPLGAIIGLCPAGYLIYRTINSGEFGVEIYPLPKTAVVPVDFSSIKELGAVLYTDYLLAFEIASIVLLVAIVAAIALTMRRRKDSKYIDPATQVAVQAQDRVKLVNLSLAQPVKSTTDDSARPKEDAAAGAAKQVKTVEKKSEDKDK